MLASRPEFWHSSFMQKFILILGLIAFSHTASAGSLMTADEFDSYTRGKTFYYANQGQPYGGEEYLDNRRVRWSYLDGKCMEGSWYPQGDLICFIYEGQPDPQCWGFSRSEGGLVAQFENDPGRTLLYEVEKSAKPLLCLGPEIGV
jgi:hypothetical protein